MQVYLSFDNNHIHCTLLEPRRTIKVDGRSFASMHSTYINDLVVHGYNSQTRVAVLRLAYLEDFYGYAVYIYL
jgi:hypothetical protein